MNAYVFSPLSDRGDDGTGLTVAECLQIAEDACHLPGLWFVQHDQDEQGHLGVGIVSDDEVDDDSVQVFLLWREEGRVQLGYAQGEFYSGLGMHVHVDAAMLAVRRALAGTVAFEQWASNRLRIPMKPPGYTDLKPPAVPI